MKCSTILIALLLPACGGGAFQAGEPSADAAPSFDPASFDSSPSWEAMPASSESGGSPDSSSPATVPVDASSTRADASDAGDELFEHDACPPAGCLCIVVTPGYGCPAGYPYVERDAGVESCCNAP